MNIYFPMIMNALRCHLPGEADQEVRHCVSLVLGETATFGQAVHCMKCGVQQSSGVICIVEEVTVVGQQWQYGCAEVTVQSQSHVTVLGRHLSREHRNCSIYRYKYRPPTNGHIMAGYIFGCKINYSRSKVVTQLSMWLLAFRIKKKYD